MHQVVELLLEEKADPNIQSNSYMIYATMLTSKMILYFYSLAYKHHLSITWEGIHKFLVERDEIGCILCRPGSVQ